VTARPEPALETAGPLAARIRLLAATALPIAAIVGCLVCIWFGVSTIALDLPYVAPSFPDAPHALDGNRHLLVASVVADGGDPYSIDGYLYPPLGAIVMIPLAAFGPQLGIWAWFAIKFAMLLWCVVDATRGLAWPARSLVVVFVATLTCVIDDMWLGNVSIPMAAAIYLAVSRDRPWAAIPLGIVVAAFAKPFLLPVLVWMVVFRRASAISALATAAVATGLSLLLLGPGTFAAYVAALRTATAMDLSYSQGLSGIAPQLLVPASIAVLAIFAVLLWKSRDESSLLVWSLLIGLVAAPYVTHYSVVPVLAGIPAFARAHPSRTLLMAALVAPISLVAIMAATALGLVIAFPTDVLRRFHPATVATVTTGEGAG
jgi:hypothetical protein